MSPQATVGQGVSVGPYCILEPEVVIGDNCTLAARVVIKAGTTLGEGNRVHEGAVLGGTPQHTRPPAEFGKLVIGSGNTVRENCTIHRALHVGAETVIGDNNYLMVGAHVRDAIAKWRPYDLRQQCLVRKARFAEFGIAKLGEGSAQSLRLRQREPATHPL